MDDSIFCPGCGRMLQVPEAYRGRQVQCPACQNVFTSEADTAITALPKPLPFPDEVAVQTGLPTAASPKSALSRRGRYDSDEDEGPEGIQLRRAFTPGSSLALAVKVFFGLSIVLSIILIFSYYLEYNLLIRLDRGEFVAKDLLDRNDTRQVILGVVNALLNLITVIVFLVWFYRAHANLKSLGRNDSKYTSGWAVGYWFVPFLNLYRPVQVTQEIWRLSDPNFWADDSQPRPKSSNSLLIGFWWLFWLIANILTGAGNQMMNSNLNSILRDATLTMIAAEVFSIIAALLAITVVSAINARQTACAANQ